MDYVFYRKYIIVMTSSWISFFISYYIVVSTGGTIIEGIVSGIISGIIVSVFSYVFITRIEKNIEWRRIHKKDIVYGVLKKLNNADIKRDDFCVCKDDFKVWIEGLDELKKQKIYEQTIQHLKEYPDISQSLGDSIDKVKNINNELEQLKKYLSDKINNKLGDYFVNFVHSKLWCIIEGAFSQKTTKNSKDMNKFFDTIQIKSEKEKNKIIIEYGEKNISLSILCRKKFNCDGINRFLSDLIIDSAFRKRVGNLTLGYIKVNGTFDDFKEKLKNLLQDIESREEKLKGKCEECSLWIKLFGDC